MYRPNFAFHDLAVPCDAGYHHPDRTLDVCIPCPEGTYQDEQGQTFCKPCLPGSTTLTGGADHPTMCSGRVAVVYNVSTPEPPTSDPDSEEEEGGDSFGDYGDGIEEMFL